MKRNPISRAALGRMPKYLQYLKTLSCEYVSSVSIARELGLGEVQVRKDLSAVSGAGKPKIGYLTSELISSIERCLGNDTLTNAVLVGAGKLGRALLDYKGFGEYGVRIVAGFDIDESVISSSDKIFPVSELERICKSENVRIGIIAVGESSAQDVCELMLKNGIEAIWSFSPCKLKIPEGVAFIQENLALSLAYLKNQLG